MGYQKSSHMRKSGRRAAPPGWGKNKATSEANWDEVDPQILYEAISAASRDNDALLFGRTSDGGIMHLRWYLDGEPYDQYPKTVDEAEDCLQAVILAYSAPEAQETTYPTTEVVKPPSRGRKAPQNGH